MDVYISRKECAEKLGVHPQTVSNYIEKGLLSYRTIGREILVSKDSFEKFMSEYVKDIVADERCIKEYRDSIRKKKEEMKRQWEVYTSRFGSTVHFQTNIRVLMKTILAANEYLGGLLNEREIMIIEDVIMARKNFVELAEQYGLSATRICQIVNRATEKMKYASENRRDQSADLRTLQERVVRQHEHIGMLTRELKDIQNNGGKTKKDKVNTKYNPNMEKRVSDCHFSVRALNCMKSADVYTLGDLVRIGKLGLVKYRNMGRKTINEIDDVLSSFDLKW